MPAHFLGLRHRIGRVYWPFGVSAQHSSVHGAVLVQLEKSVNPAIVTKIVKNFMDEEVNDTNSVLPSSFSREYLVKSLLFPGNS